MVQMYFSNGNAFLYSGTQYRNKIKLRKIYNLIGSIGLKAKRPFLFPQTFAQAHQKQNAVVVNLKENLSE